MRLTDEKYWSESYAGTEFSEATEGDLVDLLNKYVEKAESKTSIEIGSFPGTYLPVIGRKGYLLHGIDFNGKNETELPKWLSQLGLATGSFWTKDFFEFAKENNKKFDLVCSFGFIEHFENYEEVIRLHLGLVKPGGKVIITTPNFRGWMQYIPHRLFDNNNLRKHNLNSMAPGKWREVMEANNFEVKYAGYFGKYYFWYDPLEKRSKATLWALKNVNRVIFNLNKIIKKLDKESKAYSAYCGIVAVRN